MEMRTCMRTRKPWVGEMQGSSSMMAGNDMALLFEEGQVLLRFLSASLSSLCCHFHGPRIDPIFPMWLHPWRLRAPTVPT